MPKEYIFIKNGEQWVHTIDNQEFNLAKAVYSSFVDNSLDVNDENWSIEYIDGDPKNCRLDNLKKKEI
jgi:hypothetical protein